MHLATARVELRLAGNDSLKGKRTVVRSVTQRVRNRFPHLAIAEVETQDDLQLATLGLVCLSGDARHAEEMLAKVVHFIETERLDADVEAIEVEMLAL